MNNSPVKMNTAPVRHAATSGSRLQSHLRQTFLAGVFAVIPVAVTAFLIYWINLKTSFISERLFGRAVPFLGVLVAIAAIYLAGLIVTSLLGRWLLTRLDRLLSRVPGLRELYKAWKQIALTPGGGEGMFAKVVLIPGESRDLRQLGFTSGEAIDGDASTICVFIPAAPNPMNGRLYFVPRDRCQFIDTTAEEAFKLILSTGNYVPPGITAPT